MSLRGSVDRNSVSEITTASFVDSVDIDWGTPTTSSVSPVLQDRTRLYHGYVENIGIDVTAGVITIQGADGNALSATNPGYVALQSKADAGNVTLYQITANQAFEDVNGTSEITGNLFGTTTSVAWGNALPMYLYAVTNNDEDAIAFMIGRIPHRYISPPAANIGAPDDAVADAFTDFFSFDNIDETLYDLNPCACIGSLRATKDTSDDWSFFAVTRNGDVCDGIGAFNDATHFDMPVAQNGAAASKYFADNGGTAPSFSGNSFDYTISRDGTVHATFAFQTAVAGVGAVDCQLRLPCLTDASYANGPVFTGYYSDNSASNFPACTIQASVNSYICRFIVFDIAADGFFDNEDVDTSDAFFGSYIYKASNG